MNYSLERESVQLPHMYKFSKKRITCFNYKKSSDPLSVFETEVGPVPFLILPVPKNLSKEPYRCSDNGTEEPESRRLQQESFIRRATSSSSRRPSTRRRRISNGIIRQRPIKYNRLCPINIAHIDQRFVQIRQIPIPNNPIQKGRIIGIVASTRAVLLA